MKFLATLLLGILLLNIAKANAPYLGKVQCDTPVQSPKLKNNAGYITDKDCNTVFVLPPRYGRFSISGISPNSNLELCEAVNINVGRMERSNQSLRELEKLMSAPNISTEKLSEYKLHKERLLYSKHSIENDSFEIGWYEGITTVASAQINWQNIISEYKKLNPTKLVIRLPILGAHVTATTKTSMPALLPLESPWLNKNISVGNINELQSLAVHSIYESLGGQVRLSLHGVCPIYDINTKKVVGKRPDGSISLFPNVLANVTYFYPAETAHRYTLQTDAQAVEEIINEKIKVSLRISNKQVVDELLKLLPSEKVKLHVDSEQEEATLKLSILDMLATRVLSALGEPLNDVAGTRTYLLPSPKRFNYKAAIESVLKEAGVLPTNEVTYNTSIVVGGSIALGDEKFAVENLP